MAAKMLVIVAAAMMAVSAFGAPVKLDDAERMFNFPCSGRATYKVQIDYLWTGRTHPNAYPADARFSPTVIASHGKGYTIWTPMGYATKGVQQVAETGHPYTLIDELRAQRFRNVLDRNMTEDETEDGSETVELYIEVQARRPYVSGISMLVPSPDWFTGFDNVNLCDVENGQFVEYYEQNLSVWDAGSDAGEDFLSENERQRPRDPIVSILGSRFDGIPVGTVKITKMA